MTAAYADVERTILGFYTAIAPRWYPTAGEGNLRPVGCMRPVRITEKNHMDEYYVLLARIVGAARDKNRNSFSVLSGKRLPTTVLQGQGQWLRTKCTRLLTFHIVWYLPGEAASLMFSLFFKVWLEFLYVNVYDTVIFTII